VRLDANWINADFGEAVSIATANEMDALYRAAGKDPASKQKSLFIFGSVLKENEPVDSPRVKAESGPAAMLMLHNLVEASEHGSLVGGEAPSDGMFAQLARDYRTVYEAYQPADARYLTLHRGHLMFLRPEEERFATADLISATTMTATAAELRGRIRRLQDAGYDEIVVQVTPGHETMLDDWARVFETV
jgi:5,10-methylenetetrahydromethanopterin reductase